MTSCHLVVTKTAFAHYDAVLCVGPHQVAELQEMEQLYGTRHKRLVEAGYPLLDSELEESAATEARAPGERPMVLVAPSWQQGCLLDTCIDDLLEALVAQGWRVVVRPHPEYVKRYGSRWEALKDRHAGAGSESVEFERDFSTNRTIWESDVLVTDWSSVAFEFSFCTLRPCLFIDTPMKVRNPDWQEVSMQPIDLTLRDRIGVSLHPDRARDAAEAVGGLLADSARWRERIEKVRQETVYNIRESARVCGDFILKEVYAMDDQRREVAGKCEPEEVSPDVGSSA